MTADRKPADDNSIPWLRRTGELPNIEDHPGSVVREYRLASGRSQGAVASAVGITQQFLSQLETGTRQLTIELRRAFARTLGIPPERLGLAGSFNQSATPHAMAPDVARSQGTWRAQRDWLNRHRFELGLLAVRYYPARYRLPRTSLIAAPGWVADQPVELDEVRLSLCEQRQHFDITGMEPETSAVRPLHHQGTSFASYTSAVKHLDRPRLFESRPSYRYLGGSITSGQLEFGLAAYFDKLDVSEALAHEMSIACMDGLPDDADGLGGQLPFRDLIGDPFAPGRRAIIPAITTLTLRLRRFPSPPSFLLHWRDPSRVATAAGVYDVIPAGEFQPSSVALWDRANDFSLWRNMVREYSEELLGQPEHDGTRTQPVDYDRWPLYQALSTARHDGRLSAFVLGMGMDALTLAATILTVVVIDDDVFEKNFAATVRFNDEGEVVAIGDGRAADGVPFTADAVDRILSSEPIAAPGAACLALAWQHRDVLIP
ncbi:helix-turn-helix transcriptional regulator [Labedaea rhizosphaerae]|uniref:Xre family transcriptional regulator n=1 Tax=Labedaea rhizosphaerae TaxID=598644 RepID=A0A4R6S9E3_LABRH|nr:helix-turn-helix transcriptional regulator [Labedaea rhizosphaerae]TDP96619.1 Xre family transcriptional regulator [Labedaea rhizosphaerae]